MRSSVASRNRIGPTQHRPIGCGNGFEARRQSACYHTSAGSSACRRKTGQGTGLGERFHGAKSGSHSTLRWREVDSNSRSPRLRRPRSVGPYSSIALAGDVGGLRCWRFGGFEFGSGLGKIERGPLIANAIALA